MLVMFFNHVFQQEWFNWFGWFLASFIKNGGTLRKCYSFSCRCKNIWDIGTHKKLHFFFTKNANNFKILWQIFSLTWAVTPQSSHVLYLQVWNQSWPWNLLHRMLVKFNLKILCWKDILTQSFIARNWVIKNLQWI